MEVINRTEYLSEKFDHQKLLFQLEADNFTYLIDIKVPKKSKFIIYANRSEILREDFDKICSRMFNEEWSKI